MSVIGINQSEMVSGQTQSSQPRDRQSIIWLLDKNVLTLLEIQASLPDHQSMDLLNSLMLMEMFPHVCQNVKDGRILNS